MANFKGGFAFNNEAAKAEVEQAPDGTLISCVNPVTGEGIGGNTYDYRIDVAIEGSTVTADFNGSTLTEIAKAIKDDPATSVLAIIHRHAEAQETPQALILYASYDDTWGDVASTIKLLSFIYDSGDDKYQVRQTVLSGSGNSTTTRNI